MGKRDDSWPGSDDRGGGSAATVTLWLNAGSDSNVATGNAQRSARRWARDLAAKGEADRRVIVSFVGARPPLYNSVARSDG
jgi:hypothetical protein